jgi:transmembrane sensor
MKSKTIVNLADRYLSGKANEDERRLVERFLDGLASGTATELTPEEQRVIEPLLFKKIEAGLEPGAKLIPLRRTWIRVAAAAAVIFAIAGGWWFFMRHQDRSVSAQMVHAQQDVLPGRDAAILTLADGRKIRLDSTTGTIVDDNGIQIINMDGLLSYEAENVSGEMVYNTITTARGNQYQLQLEDGTRVWLNSASSLRYPVAFKGRERKVSITGEAYFEVATDAGRPFNVEANGMTVQVLGTYFNLNSYADEKDIKATLLEGSIRVVAGENSAMVKPGQQAVVVNDDIHLITNVDIDAVMAWKKGFFSFDGADIREIMKQLSRWYDVEVIYQGMPKDLFAGKIDRNLTLSQVLKLLSDNKVNFRIEDGKRIIILP